MSRNDTIRSSVVLLVATVILACGGGETTAPRDPVSVSLTPISATVNAGATQNFTATVLNATNPALTWTATGGTINGAGASATYTAPLDGGPFTVTATSVEDNTKKGTATVTVNPVTVALSPTTATVAAGGTQQFTVTVGNASNTAVTWTATGGTIDGTGSTITYTAPATGGSYTVRATSVLDPSKSGTAAATVTSAVVSLTPTAQVVSRGEPVTMTATVTGAAIATVTWSATCGTVAGAGPTVTWTAPSQAGPCSITAASALDPTRTATTTMTVTSAWRVSTNADTDDGACTWTHCSLREAITAANSNPGPDTIRFVQSAARRVGATIAAAVATLTLSSALPVVTTDLHLIGPGADLMTIDANATEAVQRRVLMFDGNLTGSVTGFTLRGGVSNGGAGIAIRNGAAVTLRNLVVRDNEARDGGGGGISISNANGVLENVVVEHNTVIGANQFGGGINIGSNGSATITGGAILNNTVENGWGGGVRMLHGTLTMTGVTVEGNDALTHAGGGGGGMHLDGTGSAVLANLTIRGNNAPTGEGGGLRIVGTSGLSGSITNSTITENTAHTAGGVSLGNLATFSVTGSTVSKNTASTRVGGVFLSGTSDVTVTNSTISENVAAGAGGGGGFYQQNTAKGRLVNTHVIGNRATGNGQVGGGVTVGSGSTFEMTGGSIRQNETPAGSAGGIGIFNATAMLTSVAIEDNRATTSGAGGGMFIQGSTLTVNGGTFAGNFSGEGAGGAIFHDGANSTFTGTSFTGNECGAFGGGAMQILNASTVSISGATFDANKCAGNSGAVGVLNTSSLTITNSVFTNNQGTFGGAMQKSGASTLAISGSRFTGNTASSQSGALHLLVGGTTTLQRVSVLNNASQTGGGGLTAGGVITIENSTVAGNTTAQSGGGMFLSSTSVATVRNTTVSGNSGGTGGGIAVTGNATLTNLTIVGNTATVFGGGLAANNNGVITVSNSLLSGNTLNASAANCGTGGAGQVNSGGYNLSADGSCLPPARVVGASVVAASLSQPTDRNNVAAGVSPTLADNGGPTMTHALLSGSTAINGANPATCPATDQRGAPRVGACDNGAFEFGGTVPAGGRGGPASGAARRSGGGG